MADGIEYFPPPKPLNGALSSQMSMFNLKPSPEHRWPAGYTPERKAEVASAMAGTEVESNHHYPPGSGSDEVFLHSQRYFTPSADDPHRGKWARSMPEIDAAQSQQAKNVITDVVARSTVPAEDVAGMPSIRIRTEAGGSYAHPGHAHTETKTVNGQSVPDLAAKERGRITLGASGKRSWQEHTILHELGHHVDYRRDPDAFDAAPRLNDSEGRRTPVSPVLEGAAEGYAALHHVPRRNDPKPTYAENASYRNLHGDPEFDRRFEEVSGQSPQAAVAPPPVENQRLHMNRQQFLFARDAPSDVTQAEGYRDWGQHHLRMDRPGATWRESTEDRLDTITLGRGLAAHGLQKDEER